MNNILCNIRSVRKNLEDLIIHLENVDTNILGSQETQVVDGECDLYNISSELRGLFKHRSAHDGGLALLIHDKFRPMFLNNSSRLNDSLEN